MATLTLLTVQGTIHQAAGLNWGANPNNHTTPLDAYIPIHIGTIRANPGLFPPKAIGVQNVVNLTWDDGVRMTALFEGNLPDSRNGLVYPKQISSTPHKRTMGNYFRTRLGVPSSHFITLGDLHTYGRMTVDINQTGPNDYFIDFHV